MTETTLCGYCVELPEKARAAAEQFRRCPLCKTALGVGPAGERFRISAATAPRRHGLLLTALAAVGLVATTALYGAWAALHTGPPLPEVILPPPPAPIAAASFEETPHLPAAPADVAVAKRYVEGVLSPDARVKPHREPAAPVTRAGVQASILATVADPARPPMAFAGKPATPAPATSPGRTAEEERKALAAVPEVVLESQQSAADTRPTKSPAEVTSAERQQQLLARTQAARKHIGDLVKRITDRNDEKPDGFIRSLMAESSEHAGLPFRLGAACQLPSEQVRPLLEGSLAVRMALSAPKARRSADAPNPLNAADSTEAFWHMLAQARMGKSSTWLHMDRDTSLALLPSLMQILAPADPALRVGLVGRYRHWAGREVTLALARLALYDPQPSVRMDALDALRDRPADEYRDFLVAALGYPWAPVAERAADAVVFLDRRDLIPSLTDMLREPDPGQPFEHVQGSKKVIAVRELVRVNHHRNCLLCHAPAPGGTSAADRASRNMVVGPVPSPAEALPPSFSPVYYAPGGGRVLVRADVTYLRQDFSLMLPVEKAAPWPEMQRFDFLVRTRALTGVELRTLAEQTAPPPLSHQRLAVLSALRRLTGLDVGPAAAAWQQALETPTVSRAVPARVDCRK